jgi:hypothetical protein
MLNVMLGTDPKYMRMRVRPSAYSASKCNGHASPEKHISNHLGSCPEITY